MPFTEFMRDTLILIKSDGSRTEGIKGNVQKNKIYIHRSDIHIEPGDELHRLMPTNKFEVYTVTEPGYRQGLSGIPAGYQAEVLRKSQIDLSVKMPSAQSRAAATAVTNNYHFHGDNNRVNNQSTDNSYNSAGSHDDIHRALDTLKSARQEISALREITELDIKTINATLSTIETRLKTNEPSRPVIKTLMEIFPEAVKALPSVVKLLELFKV